MVKAKFGKGDYFIGDICYALREDIYDKIWGKKYEYKDGVFEVEGSEFVVVGTAYGDGSFVGSDGTEYGVDAGVIGIVPIELWDKKEKLSLHGGRVVRVFKSLEFSTKGDGYFEICIDGKDLTIDTM